MKRKESSQFLALGALICLLSQLPVHAAAGDGAGAAAAAPAVPATHAAAPAAATAPATGAARPKAASRSPYAAWRVQHEQGESTDASGHGHRAQLPAGQSHPRRLP